MPDAPVAEGPPMGREDPGGGGSGLGTKIGPLPLGLWILVGGGILFGVWWFRGHNTSSSSSGSSDPGAPAGTDSAGNPLASPDGTTLAALLKAIQDLAAKQAANAVSPAPPAPSYAGTPQGNPLRDLVTTSHTTGGNDTQSVSNAKIPAIAAPATIASRTFWKPGEMPGVTSPKIPVLVTEPSPTNKVGDVLVAALPWAFKKRPGGTKWVT